MYVDVIVDILSGETDRIFEYSYDGDDIRAGDRVLVPFGGQKKDGFVIRVKPDADYPPERIKRVIAKLDDVPALTEECLRLAERISEAFFVGKAAALRLAKDGFDIIGACRSSLEALDETRKGVEAYGRSFKGAVFDVADRVQASKWMAELFGDSAPDVVVYNAGIARDNMFVFMSPEEWDSVIHTNLDGFYHTVQPLLFGMIARRSGRIIVITSASGQSGQAGQVNYAASKAALVGFTQALAKELGLSGIRVNCVCPGVIDTDMMASFTAEDKAALAEETPVGRLGTAEEVAKLLLYLAGEDAGYITGQVFGVNGGLVI